ncbi:MAG TPA: peptide chain release factor N(5)-glutamine methyltransferase [Micromonosporaceae bacterium]
MTRQEKQPAEEPERLSAALAAAAAELAAAGVQSPRTDAELLAAHVLGVPRGRLALVGELSPARARRLHDLVADRAKRVPLQHLVGSTVFLRLELAVGPGVFVPRPETELLAEWGISAARERGPGAVVVDLGSGSGAIALAVAHEVRVARVYAVERAPAALGWLRRNVAVRAAAGDPPVTVVAGDATDSDVLAELDGTVDVLLCNPPYVPSSVGVPPEVAEHDPADAVFGGSDGLAVIGPVIGRAGALLRPGGALGIEHDDTHAAAVRELLAADGRFDRITDHVDLASRPRFCTATRNGGRALDSWQTGTS